MRLRKLLISTLLLILMSSRALFAQNNLVLNGDFEQYSKCPYDVDQIMLATGWTPIDTLTKNGDLMGNPRCSADYCNFCGTGQWNKLLRNDIGYQNPHSGKGITGVAMYIDEDTPAIYYLRDYIQAKLSKKLTAGKSYCASLYVVLAERSNWAVKEISAYLDNGTIDTIKNCGFPQTQYTPQITWSGSPITDTMNWTKIEGSFIATGNERFITIGNFKGETTTTILKLPFNGWNGTGGTYYFIDDVSVVESTTIADAGPDKHVGAGDSIYIGRPSSEAIWCDWQVLGNSTIIGQGPGIWVKPTKTTSYVMTQTLCGNVTRDTVKVEVWKAGVQSINGQSQQYSIAPNPNNGAFELVQSVARDEQSEASVVNTVGQKVYSYSIAFGNGRASVAAVGLPAGVYYLSLKTKEGYVWNMRFVRQ